ncbi:MAG: hypothetical protein EZS28_033022 [Streblomastix strix]|uniref:Uncharacterized protein n=1 Tax=Streblomastix strix TaxID=222440 RepID=A0A5J4UN74_9EUKA|nr:MAG: hypothetical protein EZS28_033022 [Streblomastix strix]
MTSNPRRAIFFIEGVEQKNFVIGIPQKIRFYAFISKKSSSFQIMKFEKLIQSLSHGVLGLKGWELSKDWKQ